MLPGFKKSASYFAGLVILSLLPLFSLAQAPKSRPPADSSKSKQVIIDSTKVLRFIDGVKQLVGNVQLRQGDAKMFCDSASVINNNVKAYGHVIIQQKDSIFVYSDTLFYFGDNRKATLFGDVLLTDSVQKLFTKRLDYDLNTKVGTYKHGARLENGGTKLTSRKGYYYVRTKEAFFSDNVEVVDSNYTLQADSLKLDTKTRITYFTGPTRIQTKENNIYCEAGFYDTRKNYAEFEKNARLLKKNQLVKADKIRYDGDLDQAYLEGRTEIQEGSKSITAHNGYYDAKQDVSLFRGDVIVRDSSQSIFADSLDYFGKINFGIARGKVILLDNDQKTEIRADYAEFNDSTGYLKASGRPLLTSPVEGDTLWLAADTLFYFKAHPDDSSRIMIADNKVRMYKSDFQAICDSLVYESADSIFRFFQSPVIWSDTSQFSADTIRMHMANDRIDKIDLIEEGIILNTRDSVYFNQIKGRDILAFFKEENLERMQVSGNGESVYYLEDDNEAYIGVNKTLCSEMLLFFGNNKVRRIHFYDQPKATIFPMGQISHNGIRLAGFDWQVKKRPKSSKDLRYPEG